MTKAMAWIHQDAERCIVARSAVTLNHKKLTLRDRLASGVVGSTHSRDDQSAVIWIIASECTLTAPKRNALGLATKRSEGCSARLPHTLIW
jgi:hypothetical protein